MIDAELRTDLRRTFAAALDHEDPTKAREQLLNSGWIDALTADEPVAVSLLFRLQGQTRQDAAALDDVVAHHLAAPWSAAAEPDLAVAYPVTSNVRGDVATTHVALPANRHARRLLWIDHLATDHLKIVERGNGHRGQPVVGIDPYYGLLGFSSRPEGRTTEFSGARAHRAWAEAMAAAQVAVAHQMIAGANALLSLATEYARARKQFGTPIAGFQAVKHRLAETLVAIAAADAAAVAAGTSVGPTNAALAKVLAGRAVAAAGRNCFQIFGGIGFTAEHEFHRYFRRNLALDRLLGDTQTLERHIGEMLRTNGPGDQRTIGIAEPPLTDLLELPGRS
jgi:Acyl-CoA dehydrogenase, C-terminal domain